MTFPPPTQRQARLIWLALSGLALAVMAGLAVAFIWGLGQVLRLLSPVLWPLAVAGVLAYLLDPLVDFFERKGARRPRAILTVFGIALVIVLALFAGLLPQLVTETRQLIDRIPAYGARLEQRAQHWLSHPPPLIRNWLERAAPQAPAAPPDTNAGAAAVSTNAI